jgi:maltooligosyltrehalose trehalohydrolase
MGEEWAAATPWAFFSSFPDPELGRAVSEGRRREFASHGWDAAEVPDPQDPGTFASSKLDWSEPGREPHASALAWYRRLIALRRQHGELSDPRLDRVRCAVDEEARTLVVHRGRLRVAVNLDAAPRTIGLDGPGRGLLAASAGDAALAGSVLHLPAESVAIVELA